MSEQISGQPLKTLLAEHYGVTAEGEPVRLPGEGGQQVFKVELTGGETWTVRLGLASRPREKLLAETRLLAFLNRANFPAPRLKSALAGAAVFEWQPGLWGYALEFIEGNHPDKPQPESPSGPMLDKISLAALGHLLGRLHSLPFSEEDHLPEFTWLDEVPQALEWAGQAALHPEWVQRTGEVVAVLENLPMAELKRLPRVITHTDAHEGNLIWTPQRELYLLDWENAGLDPAALDLALVLSWFCCWRPVKGTVGPPSPETPSGLPAEKYDFDEEYCKTFLANYQQERVLTLEERRMLAPLIQFLNGWFSTRNFKREAEKPGSTGEMAGLTYTLMRSVTPQWAATLTRWAGETAPDLSK